VRSACPLSQQQSDILDGRSSGKKQIWMYNINRAPEYTKSCSLDKYCFIKNLQICSKKKVKTFFIQVKYPVVVQWKVHYLKLNGKTWKNYNISKIKLIKYHSTMLHFMFLLFLTRATTPQYTPAVSTGQLRVTVCMYLPAVGCRPSHAGWSFTYNEAPPCISSGQTKLGLVIADIE